MFEIFCDDILVEENRLIYKDKIYSLEFNDDDYSILFSNTISNIIMQSFIGKSIDDYLLIFKVIFYFYNNDKLEFIPFIEIPKWLYRSREYNIKFYDKSKMICDCSNFKGYPKNECGVPPKELIHEGRFYQIREQILYLATDEKTAIYETYKKNRIYYSIAKFKMNCDSKILNLAVDITVSEKGSFAAIINKIIQNISHKISDYDFSEYYYSRSIFSFVKCLGIDGIRYYSFKNKLSDIYNFAIINYENFIPICSYVVEVDEIYMQHYNEKDNNYDL